MRTVRDPRVAEQPLPWVTAGAGADSPLVLWLPAGRLRAEKGAEMIQKYAPGPGVTRPAGDAQATGVTA